ncbi:Pyruvate:ferredoxin oxidoreductase, alpha subunit [Parageobacillus caldoxylosilyticus]|uniref:Pyruvate:ferredoxin oxidoreductase, alpha subunit n=1 Tax=Saccharococcus caldoxylosilyticus TaxID=81408 RepID=A0A150LWJ7_9BACL|nr:Pyruvate:ferredoxin oxidoreductase, alpha subunit [Parageobacillus caldoxylosilyticus]
MAMLEEKTGMASKAEQETAFASGNEMAALAAAQINYHIMGYFPITPSTEIAQLLDQMKLRGEHSIQLIPADGEHGSAGICYGASIMGARVLNATSANGLMYMLEQLPVQSGTRFPMVLNLVTRSISGPLDIHGDHSDLYFALNTGWVILLARTPQAVYDMNIMALKIAEHADVRFLSLSRMMASSHRIKNAKCAILKIEALYNPLLASDRPIFRTLLIRKSRLRSAPI